MEIRKLDSSRSVRSQDIYNTLDLNRETSTDCFYIPLLNYSCREEKVYGLAQVFTRNKTGQHPNNGRGLIWLGHASSHIVKMSNNQQ